MNERQYHLVKVIGKIPVFEGFDLEEIQRLLRVCNLRNVTAGEDIYMKGEASDEMLVLLKGKLSVTSESGEELAAIRPGRPIGEMGVFTGQPRSANIVSVEDSTVIAFKRQELGALLMAQPGYESEGSAESRRHSEPTADGSKRAEREPGPHDPRPGPAVGRGGGVQPLNRFGASPIHKRYVKLTFEKIPPP